MSVHMCIDSCLFMDGMLGHVCEHACEALSLSSTSQIVHWIPSVFHLNIGITNRMSCHTTLLGLIGPLVLILAITSSLSIEVFH